MVHEASEASCATQTALRKRLVSLLENDPFKPDAVSRIEVRFGRAEGGFEAEIRFKETDEQPEARRSLRTRGFDCEALLGAVALSMVLAIDPVRGLTLVSESSADLEAAGSADSTAASV